MNKIEQARKILEALKVPAQQQNDMCCLVLLAMANLLEDKPWARADNPWVRIHDVIAFANSCYGTTYAENSRETFRKHAMHHFRNAAFIEDNGMATNSPNTRNHEQVSFALLFAIKYNFSITHFDINSITTQKDCLLLLMAYLYSKAKNDVNAIKELKSFARTLKADDDAFDGYWLFLYEILPMSELKGDWKPMKKAGISFIKDFSLW